MSRHINKNTFGFRQATTRVTIIFASTKAEEVVSFGWVVLMFLCIQCFLMFWIGFLLLFSGGMHVNGVSNTMWKGRCILYVLAERSWRLQISSSCGLDITEVEERRNFFLLAIFSWLKMVGSACLCVSIMQSKNTSMRIHWCSSSEYCRWHFFSVFIKVG